MFPFARVLKGKPVEYSHKTKKGLRYTTPVQSKSKPEFGKSFNQDHSSDTSSWYRDTSIGTLFTGHSINIVSASKPEDEEEDIMLHLEYEPWIKHLNALWELHFKQYKPSPENKLILVIMGDENHLNLSSSARTCRQPSKMN